MQITFFTYLNAILKKEKSYDEYYNFFKNEDNFKNFDAFMICRYLYQGNMVQYANYFNTLHGTLDKEQFFKLMYFIVPRNNIFIKYNKKIKKEQKQIINYIKEFYIISNKEAEEYLSILSDEDLKNLLIMFGINEKERNKILE